MKYKMKETPVKERPREKAMEYGVESLSDAELLAVILKTGAYGKDVLELAYEILKKYDDLSDLANASMTEMMEFLGIGKAKALELLCCFEMGKRMQSKRKIKIKTGLDVYNLLYSKLAYEEQEVVYAIMLDNKKNIIKKEMIFKGTFNKSVVYPRDVFREALKVNAAGLILVHNHPSGDVTPSKEDKEITDLMKKIGKEIGVSVIDHIIIGYNNYYSFYDNWWD